MVARTSMPVFPLPSRFTSLTLVASGAQDGGLPPPPPLPGPPQPVDRHRSALPSRRHQPWLGRKPRSAPSARLDESPPRSRRGGAGRLLRHLSDAVRGRPARQASCTDRSGGVGVAARARHLSGERRRSPFRLV